MHSRSKRKKARRGRQGRLIRDVLCAIHLYNIENADARVG
jgi:hypothetical protein